MHCAGNLTYNFRDPNTYKPVSISSFSLGASDPAPTAAAKPADWGNYTETAKCVPPV